MRTMLLGWLCWWLSASAGVRALRHRFIYPAAPEQEVQNAYYMGTQARSAFVEQVVGLQNEDEQLQLFAQNLMSCSAVASDLQEFLNRKIGPEAEPGSRKQERIIQVLNTVGLDGVASRLLSLPEPEIRNVIQTACLKNELQFQCAFGFMDDIDRVQEHINDMKNHDGNLKVMFEAECRASKGVPRLYSCVANSTNVMAKKCFGRIIRYNETRQMIESELQELTRFALELVAQPAELEEEISAQMLSLNSVLNKVIQLEELKCSDLYDMEECVLDQIGHHCGPDALAVIRTILRMGRLQRERGARLSELFDLVQAPAGPKCAPFV